MKSVGSEVAARESVLDVALLRIGRDGRDDNLEQMSAALLLHQRLSSNDFGLHGKAITITYGLVGNVRFQLLFNFMVPAMILMLTNSKVVGLVLTYSVIMYQFKEGY